MTTTVQDAPERSRFEIEVDGELAGFVDYRKDGDEYALPHTRIYPQFEGHGLGGELVRGALVEIGQRGGTVLPYCPFVPKVIRDNPELTELVREEERAGFGL
ncbi:MAG: GNAT family N-acetyltransferase [Aeromicrobium sp.]